MEIGFIYAIGAAVTWGLVYALDQKILVNVSPATLLFVDSIMAAMIMLPFVFFDQGSIKELFTSGKSNLLIIFIAIFLTTFANFLVLSSIKHLDASTTSVIEIAYPFFVVLFSFILFRSTPNIYFFIGGAFVFVGSVIIVKLA